MLDNKTALYTDSVLKKELKRHTKTLGLSMSEYLRCLVKINLAENYTDSLSYKYNKKMKEVSYMRERLKRGRI
jgi:hypothetical protein